MSKVRKSLCHCQVRKSLCHCQKSRNHCAIVFSPKITVPLSQVTKVCHNGSGSLMYRTTQLLSTVMHVHFLDRCCSIPLHLITHQGPFVGLFGDCLGLYLLPFVLTNPYEIRLPQSSHGPLVRVLDDGGQCSAKLEVYVQREHRYWLGSGSNPDGVDLVAVSVAYLAMLLL